VNQRLADLTELLRVHPTAQKNQLSIQPMAADAWVRINGTDLIQVLLNLSINALQCSETPHRVQVQGTFTANPVDFSAFADGPERRLIARDNTTVLGKSVALTVVDNGPGMTPDIVSKLFQPYFTTKPQPHGTGIGLTIVKRLICEAGGAIHVDSKPGSGTTFTIYLPAGLMEPA
jgi:signal transduction histidine kinase